MGLSGPINKLRRREFLFGAGAICSLSAGSEQGRVVILTDEACGAAVAPPVRWALTKLTRAFETQRMPALIADATSHVEEATVYLVVGARDPELRKGFGAVQVPTGAESLGLTPGRLWGKPAV